MARIKFTHPFLIAGGPQYRPGECADILEDEARQAVEQGVAVRVSAYSHPPVDKMIKNSNV
ncbi:MAG TPA: hypothetical protein VLB09_08795, partial [Nitrospiria bacterium]|nr:hypothetical protein [Nitrospiria bacterium]